MYQLTTLKPKIFSTPNNNPNFTFDQIWTYIKTCIFINLINLYRFIYTFSSSLIQLHFGIPSLQFFKIHVSRTYSPLYFRIYTYIYI